MCVGQWEIHYVACQCRVLLIWLDRLYVRKKLLPLQFLLSCCHTCFCMEWNDVWICLAEYPFSQGVILR